jgi:hypothetical protein
MIIKYGGNTYVCIANHTSPNNENLFYTNPGTYTSYWSLQAESLFSKGAYAADTWYKLNDLVKYGARQYRCTTAHTSASTVGGVAIINGSNFELYIEAIDYKGNWTTSTYYKVKDVFKFGGNQYIVDTAHTSGATEDDFDQSVVSLFTEWYNNGKIIIVLQQFTKEATKFLMVDILTFMLTLKKVQDKLLQITHIGMLLQQVIKMKVIMYTEQLIKTGDVVRYGGNSYVSLSKSYK